jgi:peptidoglycan/xylan/chitin deacetylase (PgdA/CDA1 family)
MYHGFSDATLHDGIENCSNNHVFAEHFKQQVRFLKRYFNVISLDKALELLRSGRGFPSNTIVLTIDEGYKSVYSLAFPVLREFGVPATVFCVTNFIGGREYLWFDRLEYAMNTTKQKHIIFRYRDACKTMPLGTEPEKTEAIALIKLQLKKGDPASIPEAIKQIEQDLKASLDSAATVPDLYKPLDVSDINEMERSGIISIGSHTVSHAILSRCAIGDMEKELRESKDILEDSLRKPVDLFCYPNGQQGDFNDVTQGMVKQCGFDCAVTAIDGMNSAKTDSFELRRYWVRSTIQTIPEFALLVCGFLSYLYRMKRNVLGLFS